MEKKHKLIIVGIGSNARQAHDFVRFHNLYEIAGFAVNREYYSEETYLGLPVLVLEDLRTHFLMGEINLFVALGWNRLNADRRKVYEQLKREKYTFANLISPTAIIRGSIEGDNCWINDYVVIQSGAVIKSDTFIREHVVIGDNTVINEHCFVGIKSLIAGGCSIGEQCFCGIHSTIFDEVTIGKKCIIGGSAVVKRNMSDCSVCKTDTNNMVTLSYDETIIESKLMFSKNVRGVKEMNKTVQMDKSPWGGGKNNFNCDNARSILQGGLVA